VRLARRIALLLLLVVIVLGLFAGWQAYQLRQDLKRSEVAVNQLEAAVRSEDVAARNVAAKTLADDAASAADRADGFVWGLVEHAPVYGDDARAVTAISRSLDILASRAVQPLLLTVDSMDGLTGGGRIDVDKLKSVQEPVQTARDAVVDASATLEGVESAGLVGPVQRRYDEYVDRLDDLVDGLGAGERALKVLPSVLGADGPRDYLLVFQNNAEIRATGGIPGSWAQVHTDQGALRIVKQGNAGSFTNSPADAVPITKPERDVYSKLLGVFWQDATFTPDWPRAAELLTAHWQRQYPDTHLDGVISLDPVAISYLLAGTGPVTVGDVAIDSSNAVEQLLSAPYLRLDGYQQDDFFAEAARSVFDALTGDLASPLELVRGLDRAVGERRFLVTLFDTAEARLLRGSGVTGDLPDRDGKTPRVVVALNDATASKMSYYLRYDVSVEASSCDDGRQALSGRLDLSQTITAEQAAQLPVAVTGPGDIGIPLGSQLVVIRVYTPVDGTIENVTVAGAKVDVEPVILDGRAVVTLVAQLSGPEVVPVTWTMTSGEGQVGDGRVLVSPGVEPRTANSSFASAC